jgi:hypothetical protein
VLCEPPTMNSAEMGCCRKKRKAWPHLLLQPPLVSPGNAHSARLINRGRTRHDLFRGSGLGRSRGIPLGIGGWFTKRSGGGSSTLEFMRLIGLVSDGTPPHLGDRVGLSKLQASCRLDFRRRGCSLAFIRFENNAVVQLKTSCG